MTQEEPKTGTLHLTSSSHAFVSELVDRKDSALDNPFESRVEAFRFAFALGYALGKSMKVEAPTQTVSPRGFIAKDYAVIVGEESSEKGMSLGGLISEYAEAGCVVMKEHLASGGQILDLM